VSRILLISDFRLSKFNGFLFFRKIVIYSRLAVVFGDLNVCVRESRETCNISKLSNGISKADMVLFFVSSSLLLFFVIIYFCPSNLVLVSTWQQI
jgi:hypothetical protein